MSGSVNKVTLLGRMGADPEIKDLNSGSSVANLRIATSETWKDKATGERKEKSEWHRVVVWNDGLVGVIQKFLKKGMMVYVEGQIETRKWQAQDGTDRYSTEIVVKGYGHTVNFFETAKREDRPEPENRGQPTGGASSGYRGPAGGIDDEIPF